jgi:hypothetical protein
MECGLGEGRAESSGTQWWEFGGSHEGMAVFYCVD